MKIGDIIATPNGEGTIVDIEEYSRLKVGIRYGVILKNNPLKHCDQLNNSRIPAGGM
mgnify:CR=1 FL=1